MLTEAQVALFGDYVPAPRPIEPERDKLLRQARTLRELAARGMHVRSYPKEAARLEALAAALEVA